MSLRDRLSDALNSATAQKHPSPLAAASSLEDLVKGILSDAYSAGIPLPPKADVIALVKTAYDAIVETFPNPRVKFGAAALWPIIEASISHVYDKWAAKQAATAAAV